MLSGKYNSADRYDGIQRVRLWALWEESQEPYEQVRIKPSEAAKTKMAHSAMPCAYSGLFFFFFGSVTRHGCWDGGRGSRAFFVCATTAARVSQYEGDLWMSLVHLQLLHENNRWLEDMILQVDSAKKENSTYWSHFPPQLSDWGKHCYGDKDWWDLDVEEGLK